MYVLLYIVEIIYSTLDLLNITDIIYLTIQSIYTVESKSEKRRMYFLLQLNVI